MSDPTHLDEFTETISEQLQKRLVQGFVASVRDPKTMSADHSTALKSIMEEFLFEEVSDAPAQSNG